MTLLRYVAPTSEQVVQAETWVSKFAERWAKPNADNLRDLMHPDTRNLIPPMKEPGDAEAVMEHFRGVIAAVPDFRLEVLRWAPVEDAVMLEWQASANIAGRKLAWQGVDRVSLRSGRTYEGQVFYDTRGVAEMMAAVLAEAQAGTAQQA